MWALAANNELKLFKRGPFESPSFTFTVKQIAKEPLRHPSPQEFNEALQNPSACFADEELSRGQVRSDGLGLPRPITGGFASVYQIQVGARNFAVRCFLRQSYRSAQYEIVAAAIKKLRHPSLVDFEYQERGIRCTRRIIKSSPQSQD